MACNVYVLHCAVVDPGSDLITVLNNKPGNDPNNQIDQGMNQLLSQITNRNDPVTVPNSRPGNDLFNVPYNKLGNDSVSTRVVNFTSNDLIFALYDPRDWTGSFTRTSALLPGCATVTTCLPTNSSQRLVTMVTAGCYITMVIRAL